MMRQGMLWIGGIATVMVCGGCNSGQQSEPAVNIVKIEEKTTIKPAPTAVVVVATPVAKPRATPTPVPQALVIPTMVPLPAATPVRTPNPQTKPHVVDKPKTTPATAPKVLPVPAKTPGFITLVRAEIISASKVPEPRKVAYRNSIVFFKYKVLSVEDGIYDEKELLAAHWGMRDKKLQTAAFYKVGDVQTLEIEPLEKHPELESQQRNDDTGENSLEPYWVKAVR